MAAIDHSKEIIEIRKYLRTNASPELAIRKAKFFKTSRGEYGENSVFIGFTTPQLKAIAKNYKDLRINDIETLMQSKIHEERALALFLCVNQYKKCDDNKKKEIYDLYLKNLSHINNWDLVDISCYHILGPHLLHFDKDILFKFAKSKVLWERRIAIVTTMHFIRHNNFDWTIKIAEILLADHHDLIHKAVGWMLREMGKHDKKILTQFLGKHATTMPRTMLRYAIEKFPAEERKAYLLLKKS